VNGRVQDQVNGGPLRHTPTSLLQEVGRRLDAAFDAPVVLEGRIVGVRTSKGWTTVTLGDAEPSGRFPTRLQVSLDPRVGVRTLPDALAEQTLVQVTGRVGLWVNRAEVQLKAVEVVRVGHSQTQQSFEFARAAIATERLGERRPALPLFLRRVLLLAPTGTTLGDLTRDLGGWHPPDIVHVPIPGDSPDLHHLVDAACADHPDVDVVVVARGGAIEAISGWDDLRLLRCLDRLQGRGVPILLAVGHADHTPLVYRVASYTVRHTAEAGRWLADHNRASAGRIRELEALPALLGQRLRTQRERVRLADRQLGVAVRAAVGRRRTDLRATSGRLTDAMTGRLRQSSARHTTVARGLPATLARRVAERARRLELATATLDGFRTGIALVTGVDGGPARFVVGESLRIEVAQATVTARIETVTRHDQEHQP
jgi:exonuclease VII large subunit